MKAFLLITTRGFKHYFTLFVFYFSYCPSLRILSHSRNFILLHFYYDFLSHFLASDFGEGRRLFSMGPLQCFPFRVTLLNVLLTTCFMIFIYYITYI